MSFSRNTFMAALVLFAAATSRAQIEQPAPPAITGASAYNVHDALATALSRVDAADKDVRRFTYILDISMANIGPGGRLQDFQTLKYETLYLNNSPYMRLLEKDGAPLTGSDLKAEQKRYNKAIAKKKDLGINQRADTDGYGIVKSDVPLTTVLDSSYTLQLADTALYNGDPVHVIDANPVPTVKRMSTCLWHVRFWVSDKTGDLVRYLADTKGDDREQCLGAYEDFRYIEVDGIPKTLSETTRFNLPSPAGDGTWRTSKSVARYSNYRRFGATITIHNGEVVPNDTNPTP